MANGQIFVADDVAGQYIPETTHPVATYTLGELHIQRVAINDSDGNAITPASETATEAVTTAVEESNGLLRRLLNAILRPIWYSAALNSLKVVTDTNSSVLTYQYLVYPYSGYGPGTTVWGQSITDGLNMARTSWAVNIRGRIC